MVNEDNITVVMALYNPNLNWLQEELLSIKNQTYRKFHVLAWNDNPQDEYDYDTFFQDNLGEISFKIFKGENNMGSNGVFEKLTTLADTPYIAYSDQDDIWCLNKLEVLLNTMEHEQAALVFSDMAVIDENSNVVSENIAGVRPRHKFYPGKDALEHLLAKNFVTGCTMMMRTDIAKEAVPFPEGVFHDWWLAVCAAIKGKVVQAPQPLMKYRIYGGNQSAVLKGVLDKQTYYEHKIKPYQEFIKHVHKVFGDNKHIINALKYSKAREEYFFHPNFRALSQLLSGRNYPLSIIMFEVLLPFIPNIILKKIVEKVQSGSL